MHGFATSDNKSSLISRLIRRTRNSTEAFILSTLGTISPFCAKRNPSLLRVYILCLMNEALIFDNCTKEVCLFFDSFIWVGLTTHTAFFASPSASDSKSIRAYK